MLKEYSPIELSENATSKSVSPPTYTPAIVAISFSTPVIESSYFRLSMSLYRPGSAFESAMTS